MDSSRYQQWKQSWLVYGRVLLTLTVLVLITVSLYFAAHSLTDDGGQPIHERVIRERRWSSQNSIHEPANLFMSTMQQHKAAAMSSTDETKATQPTLYAKRVARSSVDKLSIATNNSDKISMSNQHDKYHSVNGSARDATTAAVPMDNGHINTNTSSQTVKGDTNPTIHKNDKHKKKSKRKKFQPISGIDVKSVIPNIENKSNNNNKNISDGEVLMNHIGAVSAWNDQFSATDVFDAPVDQRKIRNKKDQLIIREDTGVVVVHKVCVPCKIVPGQPSRHPPRKPSRQRPRSMFKCNYI